LDKGGESGQVGERKQRSKAMTAKEMARLLEKASDIHEASWEVKANYGRYAKDWWQCCEEAGMAQEWIGLVAPYASLGYSDLWEWTQSQH